MTCPDTTTAIWDEAERVRENMLVIGNDLVDATMTLVDAEYRVETHRAESEARHIRETARGDEKDLGANAVARSRALTIHLHQDAEYQQALADLGKARAHKARLQLQERLLEHKAKILLAVMPRSVALAPRQGARE